MAIYTLVFFGMAPIGGLLLGLLASRTNEPLAVGITDALLFIVAVGIQIARPKMRELK